MKRKLVYLLVLSLILAMLPMGVLADEDEDNDANGTIEVSGIVSYEIVIEGFDWGPGVTQLRLTLESPVEAVSLEDFEVSITRKPGFIPPAGDTDPIVQEVNLAGASLSADGYTVTLDFVVHPSRGVNPFTFTLSPMGNDWADPFTPTITWQGIEFTPERTARITPLADQFYTDGTFTHDGVTLQYASFSPSQAHTSERPLIIWLHGGGEGSRGNTVSPDAMIFGNRVTQLVAPEIQGIMGGAHVFLPQSPTMWLMGTDGRGDPPGEGYRSNYEVALIALIDQFIASTPNVDTSRIYVGGCSNGGYMAMRMLFERPDLYAAAWPICLYYRGEWVNDEKIESIAHIPIWFIHDINDPTTPHEHSQNLHDLLLAAGADNVHLYTTDGLFSDEFVNDDGEPWRFNDHWSWIPALNNTVSDTINGRNVTLFEWMAAQQSGDLPQEQAAEPVAETYEPENGNDEPADEQVTVEELAFDELTMVPLRFVAEILGAEVQWEDETRTVIVITDGNTTTLQIDTPLPGNLGMPEIRQGITFVPAIHLANMLDVNVGAIEAVL